jgi:hypothetical protein
MVPGKGLRFPITFTGPLAKSISTIFTGKIGDDEHRQLEAKNMTMTIFIVLRKMTEAGREEQAEERTIEVEEIRIRDPDREGAQIPVAEADEDDDADDEEDWPEGDEGPDHYGWEEVYELNGCSPQYL